MRLTHREFRRLAREALESLPQEFLSRLDNCDIALQDWPTPEQLGSSNPQDRYHLLGLYEGVPLTERDSYDPLLPDRITLFQRPIEAMCATREEVVQEVRRTVAHEVAHHFGISDQRLEALGLD